MNLSCSSLVQVQHGEQVWWLIHLCCTVPITCIVFFVYYFGRFVVEIIEKTSSQFDSMFFTAMFDS